MGACFPEGMFLWCLNTETSSKQGCSETCFPARMQVEREGSQRGVRVCAQGFFWCFLGTLGKLDCFLPPFGAFWKIACLNEMLVCELQVVSSPDKVHIHFLRVSPVSENPNYFSRFMPITKPSSCPKISIIRYSCKYKDLIKLVQ